MIYSGRDKHRRIELDFIKDSNYHQQQQSAQQPQQSYKVQPLQEIKNRKFEGIKKKPLKIFKKTNNIMLAEGLNKQHQQQQQQQQHQQQIDECEMNRMVADLLEDSEIAPDFDSMSEFMIINPEATSTQL